VEDTGLESLEFNIEPVKELDNLREGDKIQGQEKSRGRSRRRGRRKRQEERGTMDIWVDTVCAFNIIYDDDYRKEIGAQFDVHICVTDETDSDETKFALTGTKSNVSKTRDYIYDVVDCIAGRF
jgi:hypothetical protein